jgi:hypothetical protein
VSIAPLKPNYTAGEKQIHEKLANALEASMVNVQDISGNFIIIKADVGPCIL